MTNTLVGSTVREIVLDLASSLQVSGLVREVVGNAPDKVRVAGLVREVVQSAGSANTFLQVSGLVREVVMGVLPPANSRVMAWRMGW